MLRSNLDYANEKLLNAKLMGTLSLNTKNGLNHLMPFLSRIGAGFLSGVFRSLPDSTLSSHALFGGLGFDEQNA